MPLACVARLLGASSCNQNAVGVILGQGMYLGGELGIWSGVHDPWSGHTWKTIGASLSSVFLPLPSSLSSLSLKSNEKISSGEYKINK